MGDTEIGNDASKALKELGQALKRERERIAIQMDLGRMEVKDEWNRLEARWDEFEEQAEELGDEAKEAAHRLGEELKERYESLVQRLKGD